MKLRIAYCVSHFPYQSETYLLNQLKGLLDEGHKVTIFSLGRFKDYPRHALLEEYNLLSLTHERPFIPRNKLLRFLKAFGLLMANLRNARYLLRTLNIRRYGKYAANLQFFYDAIPYLQERAFDIVHCQFGPNGIKALNFREIGLLKGRLITSFHGFDINEKAFLCWPSHYSRKGLYRDLSKECEIFTVSSIFSKQTVVNLGIPAHKIEVLPVGLDTNKFVKDQNAIAPVAPPIILTVSRLVPFKGLEYSIRAIKNLMPSFPYLEYHILGEGGERSTLEKLIQGLGLDKNIFLHGAATQEQVLAFYNKAQVFLLSSIEAPDGEVETQGLVVQEAQSMELPVVVSNAGGTPEGLIDGRTGFVMSQKDVTGMAEKLRLLLQNPILRAEMGKAGRAFVVEHFDYQVQHQKLMRLYQRLLNTY